MGVGGLGNGCPPIELLIDVDGLDGQPGSRRNEPREHRLGDICERNKAQGDQRLPCDEIGECGGVTRGQVGPARTKETSGNATSLDVGQLGEDRLETLVLEEGVISARELNFQAPDVRRRVEKSVHCGLHVTALQRQ